LGSQFYPRWRPRIPVIPSDRGAAFRNGAAGRVPPRKREVDDLMNTPAHTHGWCALGLVGLALALAAPGCGSDDSSSGSPADDQQLVDQASKKIERAAAASANRVRDRYIPGPKKFKVVCLSPDQAQEREVPAGFMQCHVEAFSTSTKQRPESVYIESEDWRVPVEGGTVFIEVD